MTKMVFGVMQKSAPVKDARAAFSLLMMLNRRELAHVAKSCGVKPCWAGKVECATSLSRRWRSLGIFANINV